MRANVIPADRLEEAFDRPEKDHETIVNEVEAGMNGEFIREQEAPLIEDARTSGAGKAEPREPTLNLSPFTEDGSVRADDSWLNSGLRTSKK